MRHAKDLKGHVGVLEARKTNETIFNNRKINKLSFVNHISKLFLVTLTLNKILYLWDRALLKHA